MRSYQTNPQDAIFSHRRRFKARIEEDITNNEMIAPEGDMEQSEGEDDVPRIKFTYAPHHRRYIYQF